MVGEKREGPFDFEALDEMVKSGRFGPDILFAEEGGAQWLPVTQWPTLLQDAAEPVQASGPSARDGASSAEAEPLASKGDGFVSIAKVAWAIGALCFVFGLFTTIENDHNSGGAGYPAAGAFLALGMWLYLTGQVILARAAIERQR
jgi:hypothetical protein